VSGDSWQTTTWCLETADRQQTVSEDSWQTTTLCLETTDRLQHGVHWVPTVWVSAGVMTADEVTAQVHNWNPVSSAAAHRQTKTGVVGRQTGSQTGRHWHTLVARIGRQVQGPLPHWEELITALWWALGGIDHCVKLISRWGWSLGRANPCVVMVTGWRQLLCCDYHPFFYDHWAVMITGWEWAPCGAKHEVGMITWWSSLLCFNDNWVEIILSWHRGL
jgi:hypothetical protein